MRTEDRFDELICTEEQLRAVVGFPTPRAVNKTIARLDEHCRTIISGSPFVVVSSSDASGRTDVSPRGGRCGFVLVLDERTLAIPDRPGNRRADTFSNVLQNPHVGLLFLIPNRKETLRVRGRASIVRDLGLRRRLAAGEKLPELALVVAVDEAFVHCGKCILRARLWDPVAWPDVERLPTHAQCLVDQAQLDESVETVHREVQESYRNL